MHNDTTRSLAGALAAVLAITGCSASQAQNVGGPDQAIVAGLITGTYMPGETRNPGVQITRIEIGAGHRASAGEGMQMQVALGQMIYPVHAVYTLISGSGSSAYVRDWDTHFYAFRSEQKNGAWDLTSDSRPGDKNGELRGG